MKAIDSVLQGYENTRFLRHQDLTANFPNSVYYEDLSNKEVNGVLKANLHSNGKLLQIYSEAENHVGVIAATRLGKTSSYGIPTIISFAKQKIKRSMIISDPKGELFDRTSVTLWKQGYKVLVINFRDFKHSEYWNPLTAIFRKYQSIFQIYDEVEIVVTDNGMRYKFRGTIYEDQTVLNKEIESVKNMMMEDVGNDIDSIAMMVAPTHSTREPYWEDCARALLVAYIWGMLEDSRPENVKGTGRQQITEDTFAFSTIIELMTLLNGSADDFDGGFFSSRSQDSRAYKIEKSTIPEQAQTTRQCITSNFSSKMSVFRESAMRLVTSCNSFDLKEVLTGEQPVAIFINYRDELKVHYKVISLFIQDSYRILIEHANRQENGKRQVPFYFILDEFGNFPAIKDFETTISACAGRNIFFILIMQSYAQLNAVYGADVAAIIRDNLNMHVFFGSNNPSTLEEFSRECGRYTRISPLSALNGREDEIDNYQIETIPLIPQSMLAKLSPGECIITEANSGYVMLSKLERYYLCPEFNDLPRADLASYKSQVNPFDSRYTYKCVRCKRNRSWS